eukprot:Rhum_TRINITY_DN7141_c0_g1::Rhum_TRINITY_DN7141_c0_g1_i1::g.21760::m.21760
MSAAASGGGGGQQAVTKLLDKLKESQQLFDNLETMFDSKVNELGQTEGQMLQAAAKIHDIKNMLDQEATEPLPSVRAALPSPPAALAASVAPSPALHQAAMVSPRAPFATASPPRGGAAASVEAGLLHERMRQMQQEHAAQLRAHTDATERSVKTRVQQEVMARMTAQNGVVDQLRVEALQQREEAHARVLEQQAETERMRDAMRRMEAEHRDALRRREEEIVAAADARLSDEVRALDATQQALVAEMQRDRAAAEAAAAEAERMAQSLRVADEAVRELREQHAAATEGLDALTQKHQAAVAEAARLSSTMQAATEGRIQLEREYSQLQESYDTAATQLREAKTDAQRKREAYETLKAEFATLRRQVHDVHGQNEMKASESAQLAIDMSTLQQRYDDLVARSERATKQQQRELEAGFEERRQQILGEVKQKQATIGQLQSRIDDYAHQGELHEQTSAQLKQAKLRNTELEARLQDKERELTMQAEKAKRVEDVTMQLNAAELREMSLDDQVRGLQATLSEKERELNSRQAKLDRADDLRVQLTSAEVRGSTLQEREKEAQDKLRQALLELAAASEKMKKMDELKAKLREEMATMKAQNESLRDREERSRDRDSELAACRDEMNRAALELSRRQDEIASLKATAADIQPLRDELTSLREVKNMLESRDSKVESLSLELAKAQMLNEQKDKEYDVLVADYDAKEEECLHLAATNAEAEEQLRGHVRVSEELELARSSLAELQLLYDRREVALQERADQLAEGCENVAEGQAALKQEVTSLGAQLEEQVKKNEHLATMVQHKDFLLEEKDRDLAAGSEDDERLRAWVHEKVQAAAAEAADARAERDEAQTRLREGRAEAALRIDEVAELRRANDSLQGLIQSRELNEAKAARPADDTVLRAEVEHLKEALLEAQARLRRSEEDRTSCEEKLIYTGTQLASERAQVAQLRESNERIIGEINALDQEKAAEASSAVQQQEMVRELAQLRDDTDQQKLVIRRREQHLEQQIHHCKELENQVATLQTTVEMLRKRIADLERASDLPPTPSLAPTPSVHQPRSPAATHSHVSASLRDTAALPASSTATADQSGTWARESSAQPSAALGPVATMPLDVPSVRQSASASHQSVREALGASLGASLSKLSQRSSTPLAATVSVPAASQHLGSVPPASVQQTQETSDLQALPSAAASLVQPSSFPAAPTAHASAGVTERASLATGVEVSPEAPPTVSVSANNAGVSAAESAATAAAVSAAAPSAASAVAASTTASAVAASAAASAPVSAATEEKAKPTLGLTLDDTSSHSGWPRVSDVKTGGPAYKAGMRRGDYLSSLDNKKVTDSDGLNRILSKCEPNDTVAFVFNRVKCGTASEFDSDIRLGTTGGPTIKRGHSAVGSRRSSIVSVGSRRKNSVVGSAASTPQQRSLNLSTSSVPAGPPPGKMF